MRRMAIPGESATQGLPRMILQIGRHVGAPLSQRRLCAQTQEAEAGGLKDGAAETERGLDQQGPKPLANI